MTTQIRRVAAGQCRDCGRVPLPGVQRCNRCGQRQRERVAANTAKKRAAGLAVRWVKP